MKISITHKSHLPAETIRVALGKLWRLELAQNVILTAHLFLPKIPPLARDWLLEAAAVCQLLSDSLSLPPLNLAPVLKIPGDQSPGPSGWKRSHLTNGQN